MRSVFLALVLLLAAPTAPAQQPTYSGHGADSVPAEVVARFAPPSLDPALTRNIEAMVDVRSPGIGHRLARRAPTVFRMGDHRDAAGLPARRPEGVSDPDDGRRGQDRRRGDHARRQVARAAAGRRRRGESRALPAAGGRRPADDGAEASPRSGPSSISSPRTGGRSTSTRTTSSPTATRSTATTSRPARRPSSSATRGCGRIGDHLGRGADLRLLLVKVTGSFAREYFEYVPATKTLRPLLGIGEATEYEAMYAAQPGELLVRTNKFGDFRRLYRWTIGADATAASFREVLAAPGMDVSGFSIDDARRHVYAAINDGGYRRLVVLDATTFAERSCRCRRTPTTSTPAGDAGRPLRHDRRRVGQRAAHELRLGLAGADAHAVGRADGAGSRSRFVRPRAAHGVPRERRHARSRCSCASRKAARPARIPRPTPARSSSSSTAAPRVSRCPASRPTRRSSSMRASSSSSRTFAAATATARRGSTPTTDRSAST